jgi:hypothetical protein
MVDHTELENFTPSVVAPAYGSARAAICGHDG